jgi:predicted transcriptional regulator
LHSESPITFHPDDASLQSLDALAKAMNRPRAELINDAIFQFIANNAWQIERIEAGLADAKAGRVVSADAVFDGIAKKHGW